jgi:hypothetical protein
VELHVVWNDLERTSALDPYSIKSLVWMDEDLDAWLGTLAPNSANFSLPFNSLIVMDDGSTS